MYFYKKKDEEKRVPVKEFLDALPPADSQRVLWMLKLIEESEWTPLQYAFNHQEEGLWEFRISADTKNYWLLAFHHKNKWVLFDADFSTRFQKAPEKEVKRALTNKEGYTTGFRILPVSDLKKYITLRKKEDEVFSENFEKGYLHFKIGSLMRQIREEAGLTQKATADKLGVAASFISQIENHADDVELSKLEEYLEKFQKSLL